jgi:HEXXH motif-containing protein
MKIHEAIERYLAQPFPLWETELTGLLTGHFSEVPPTIQLPSAERWPLKRSSAEQIWLEAPSMTPLAPFYDDCGLTPVSDSALVAADAPAKLEHALQLLDIANGPYDCVTQLVRSIQILVSEDEEVDVSYSHPEISDVIFVSVCRDDSPHSQARVAESILHESMHLKLTLIERLVPLVKPNTGNTYFSPWRDEKRPARGVLHGLFVFRTILDFLRMIAGSQSSIADYVQKRQKQIIQEIGQLEHFDNCPDLTAEGATLVKNLLLT